MDIKTYINLWEFRCYPDGIPEELPAKLEASMKCPSYKALAKAFMKNDHGLKCFGYSLQVSPIYNDIKRQEISQRTNSNMELF